MVRTPEFLAARLCSLQFAIAAVARGERGGDGGTHVVARGPDRVSQVVDAADRIEGGGFLDQSGGLEGCDPARSQVSLLKLVR